MFHRTRPCSKEEWIYEQSHFWSILDYYFNDSENKKKKTNFYIALMLAFIWKNTLLEFYKAGFLSFPPIDYFRCIPYIYLSRVRQYLYISPDIFLPWIINFALWKLLSFSSHIHILETDIAARVNFDPNVFILSSEILRTS